MPLDILVVDDIQESRRSLCALVSDLGHSATGADGGRAALDRIRERPPDLVLVDLLMPELDGFELTRLLRELTRERWLPVEDHLSGWNFGTRSTSTPHDWPARPVAQRVADRLLPGGAACDGSKFPVGKLRHHSAVCGRSVRVTQTTRQDH